MVDQVNIPFYPPQDTGGYTQPPGTSFPPPVPYMPEPGPPIYPPQGSLPGEYGPDTPPPSSEPPSSPGEQSFYDTASGWIGGIAGGVFGSYRRRFVKSRLTKAIESAARRGLDAIFREPQGGRPPGISQYELKRAFTKMGEPTPKVFIGPPTKPPVGALVDLAGGAFTTAAGVLTGLAALFYPRGMFAGRGGDFGYGNPFQRDINAYDAQLAAQRDTRDQREQLLLMRPQLPIETGLFPPRDVPPRRPSRISRLFQTVDQWEARYAEMFPGEPIPIRIGRRLPGSDVTAPLPDPGALQPFPSSPLLSVPEAERVQKQSEAPAPAASGPLAGKGQRLPAGQIRWGQIGIGVGAIVAANTLLPRLFGGSAYPSTQTASPIALGTTIATPPATALQPGMGLQSLSFGGGASGNCSCGPRGPRRKCLERAPVAWRSGRNKGKAAGSKCVRYAQRAS